MFTSAGLFPAEKFHLLEYGILSFLAYRLFELNNISQTALIKSVAAVAYIGILDETIQWLTPSRVGTYEDILLNIKSTMLALGVIALTESSERIKKVPQVRDILSINYYLAAVVMMLALFIGIVHKFGFEIKDNEFSLYSVYSREKLQEIAIKITKDRNLFTNVEIIRALETENSKDIPEEKKEFYNYFREASLHIYERDNALNKKKYDKAKMENAILEKYYYPVFSVVKSGLRMDKPVPIAGGAESKFYKSPVKGDLIYFVNKTQLYVLSSILTVMFMAVNIYLKRRL